MKDLRLDFENKTIINEYIDNQERILQQIKLAVRSWKKDFFINEDFGVDYDNCWHDMLLMKAYISNSIQAVPGVVRINYINVTKNKDSNDKVQFVIEAEIIFDKGQINILEAIEDLY